MDPLFGSARAGLTHSGTIGLKDQTNHTKLVAIHHVPHIQISYIWAIYDTLLCYMFIVVLKVLGASD